MKTYQTLFLLTIITTLSFCACTYENNTLSINGSWQGYMIDSLYTEIHILDERCYIFWDQALNFPQLQIKYLEEDTIEIWTSTKENRLLIKLKILEHTPETGLLKCQNVKSKEIFTLKKLPFTFDSNAIFSPNKEFYDTYTEEFMLRNWDFPTPEIYKK